MLVSPAVLSPPRWSVRLRDRRLGWADWVFFGGPCSGLSDFVGLFGRLVFLKRKEKQGH